MIKVTQGPNFYRLSNATIKFYAPIYQENKIYSFNNFSSCAGPDNDLRLRKNSYVISENDEYLDQKSKVNKKIKSVASRRGKRNKQTEKMSRRSHLIMHRTIGLTD